VSTCTHDDHHVIGPGFEQLVDETEAGTRSGLDLHTLKVYPEKLTRCPSNLKPCSQLRSHCRPVNFDLRPDQRRRSVPIVNASEGGDNSVAVSLARNNLLNHFLAILEQVPGTVPHHIYARRRVGKHLDPAANSEHPGDAAYADAFTQVTCLGCLGIRQLGGRLLPKFLH